MKAKVLDVNVNSKSEMQEVYEALSSTGIGSAGSKSRLRENSAFGTNRHRGSKNAGE